MQIFSPFAEHIKDILTEHLGLDTRVTTLGHTQRGGEALRFRSNFDREAIRALLEAVPETPSYMIDVRENKITRVLLMEAVVMTRAGADAIATKDFAEAMSMRDPEFFQCLEGFFVTSMLFKEKQLPHHRRMRVAILHMGVPAGGMNVTT
ncbi:hypothetical protein DFH29DRAFT_1042883 [Suillus ampliporus]|nr:hypothetical protein DFH29DRAFT_1042883 [Suillus ampliporus]